MASILIIDDTDVIRDLLRTSLERAGYAVRVAKDGREGLREFRKAPADLVINDIYMPDCDGIEVIRGLRRLSPGLKILAISGGTGTKDFLRTAQFLGATRVLHKPFIMPTVLKTIAELLSDNSLENHGT